DLWFWAIVLPVSFFVIEIVWRLSGVCGMRLITQSEANSSKELFKYLIDHSRAYFNSKFAGSLVNRIGHATRGVTNMFSNILWQFFPLLITLIINIIIVITIDYRLGVMLSVWTIIFLILNYFMVRRKQHLSYASANSGSIMKGKMVDTISNISAVQAHAHQNYEKNNIDYYIRDSQKKHLKSWVASEWILFINGGLLMVFMFGMIGISIYLVQGKLASIGSLVLVISMTLQLASSLFFIGHKMTDAIDDYSQIEEGLNELIVPYEIKDRARAKCLKNAKGNLDFENIDFRFDNTTVFKNFSLKIKACQKVGVVGVSGAGKTTLANLLLRNHDVEKGIIKIDGHNILDITRKSLREKIAFVPQDTSLFHRMIKDNICYGRLNASDDEIIEAAKKAQAHEFIMSFPDGYDTFVGERGVKLSGGQRQRIAIARAFLKNSPILLLDEATSALDSESEILVQAALAQLMQKKTVIAIAHRLSTLRVMDRIVVLSKGKIVEDGTHETLMKGKGVYAGLWRHQVEGFIG
ncbi:ABC transporter ATP-binding protein/permease, partial [Patescibacteria group bacterium]|nr:ABC transporter ATP-binding protein/permease [Patescibacteria group bacterium]